MSIERYTANFQFRIINYNSPYWDVDEKANWDALDAILSGVQVQGSDIPFVVASGATNAYVLSYSPAITAYTAGLMLSFKTNAANTGSATVNVNGLGTKTLKRGGANLATGVLSNGGYVRIVYDGTDFIVVDPAEVVVTSAGNITPSQLSVGHPTWDVNSNLAVGGTLNAGALRQGGKQAFTHAGSYTSGSVTVSTGSPTGGTDGDLWIKIS